MAPIKNFEVVALARDSEDRRVIETYLKSMACPPESKNFQVALIPETIRQTYKFVMTPTTVIASGDGKAVKVWNGVLTSKDIANADAILGL
jgi:ketosteroid isomerase-like protein